MFENYVYSIQPTCLKTNVYSIQPLLYPQPIPMYVANQFIDLSGGSETIMR